jgi:hypothetical protein
LHLTQAGVLQGARIEKSVGLHCPQGDENVFVGAQIIQQRSEAWELLCLPQNLPNLPILAAHR